MGGEKPWSATSWLKPRGSPPHGRGKVYDKDGNLLNVGITPAWAGKRKERHDFQRVTQDHPRMGGEKRAKDAELANGKGSPPHGRGKGGGVRFGCGLHGITPAWAGKS